MTGKNSRMSNGIGTRRRNSGRLSFSIPATLEASLGLWSLLCTSMVASDDGVSVKVAILAFHLAKMSPHFWHSVPGAVVSNPHFGQIFKSRLVKTIV